ncbi:MAG: anaerobic ribonucleoside-triphosphate reductase activating protein [Clostridiales bacterium]|nr:anaerobic ribonucleoside-triphosphate reductase activating protein [Clostridiales bacterium]MDD7347105.1 anaerobic ribonucleoside-triphosphate reductase activating protein [Clostridiales bacterium]MDY4060591.1 anaerobic ribonucleoside-triphosphate reductase activating protein [Anaerovoracaceae bacterium]
MKESPDSKERNQKDISPQIRVAGFIKESIVDGPGIRFVIFCQGCPHNCKGCHNPSTHSFEGGNLFSPEEIVKTIDENPLLQGVTFSGGEPLCQVDGFLKLGKLVKDRKLHLLIYTGFTIEELEERMKVEDNLRELLMLADHLVEGRYVEKKRNISLMYRGSENQRIIDMEEYFRTGEVVPLETISIN